MRDTTGDTEEHRGTEKCRRDVRNGVAAASPSRARGGRVYFELQNLPANLMSHDAPANSSSSNKLVIRNIGLLLSGDLDHPILDADTVVAVDGVIESAGKEKDLDLSGAAATVDAIGTALAPGLIDSHVHPVCGDWTPRQNQLGWIDSCLHGGVTTMVSAGEVHTPGRPKDIVGLKAMAIFAQRAFQAFRPGGVKIYAG